MNKGNIYKSIPQDLSAEVFENLALTDGVKIERIVSKGHASPATGWYDQDQREWVIVLQGNASIAFDDDSVVRLEAGDYIDIAPHQKHRVIDTSSETETIWLAVHYS